MNLSWRISMKAFWVFLTVMASLSHSLPAWAEAEDSTYYRDAQYVVPVDDDLAEFAKFSLGDLEKTVTAEGTVYSYSLPVELTGIAGTRLAFLATDSTEPG